MSTIEEKLKDLIIERYGSMVAFSKEIDIPNPTLASIMTRGIKNANIQNIIKICKNLGISTDELAQGNIVPIRPDPVLEYAKLLAQLSKKSRESALNYISYLVEQDGKEIEIEFTKRGDSK